MCGLIKKNNKNNNELKEENINLKNEMKKLQNELRNKIIQENRNNRTLNENEGENSQNYLIKRICKNKPDFAQNTCWRC